ncbi:hypothetical protein BDW69DRAFT_126937 [Aspergillus filifer]
MTATTTNPTSQNQNPIPIVFFGYKRFVAIKFMPPLFSGTPYVMTSSLDQVSSREEFRYTPHNLGVVLETLHPRPRALIIGIAIDPKFCEEMRVVWESYVENVLNVEDRDGYMAAGKKTGWEGKSAFVPLPYTHFVDPTKNMRPPANFGWEDEMFRQLDGVFRPERVGKGGHNVVPE